MTRTPAARWVEPGGRRSAGAAATSTLLLTLVLLAGCKPEATAPAPPLQVRARTAALVPYAPTYALTGEVAARVQSDLSFRVGGQITERLFEVGRHVARGDVLARLDSKVQEADVAGAEAALRAAEARLGQAASVYERQKTLLGQGFTTRRDYDQAEQGLRSAEAMVDGAKAQLSTARDQLTQTVLRAPSDGVVTATFVDSGQVVQPSMPVCTLAEDGARDAVVNVQEALLIADPSSEVDVALVADRSVGARGEVREIAPTVNATGAVRVKVALLETPPQMVLGSAVRVTLRARTRERVILPWDALGSDGGHPAVWVVDPRTRTVASRRIEIDGYRRSEIVVREGLRPGEIVVTAGAHLLRASQPVTIVEDRS